MDYGILVNRDHRLPENYFNHWSGWVEVLDADGNFCKIEEVTYHHFSKLVEDMKKQGIQILVNSGYRSVLEQQKLFDESREKIGIEKTLELVSKPYYSEHHTGLAIDISIFTEEDRKLLEQEETRDIIRSKKEKEYQIIHQNLKKYGFILRYPKGKEKITGYRYEPWHIRYVGSLAKKIPEDMTLEEFYRVQVVNEE